MFVKIFLLHSKCSTIRIQERGLDARLSHHYSNKWSPGCLEQESGAQRREKYILEISDVFTAFAILLVGFIGSGCIILVERGAWMRCQLVGQQGTHPGTTIINLRNMWYWEVGAKMWQKSKMRLKFRRIMTSSKLLIK